MGILEEEPCRRGQRRYMRHRAAAPLAATLGPQDYDRPLEAIEVLIESALREAPAATSGKGTASARRRSRR